MTNLEKAHQELSDIQSYYDISGLMPYRRELKEAMTLIRAEIEAQNLYMKLTRKIFDKMWSSPLASWRSMGAF